MSEVIDKFRALAEAAGLQGVAPEGEATIVTKRELLEAADQLDALTAENQALRERVKQLEEGLEVIAGFQGWRNPDASHMTNAEVCSAAERIVNHARALLTPKEDKS